MEKEPTEIKIKDSGIWAIIIVLVWIGLTIAMSADNIINKCIK